MAARLPSVWVELIENINGRSVFGQRHVRDPDNPCNEFEPVENIDWLGLYVRAPGDGQCDTDGHYLCSGCAHLSREAMLDRLDTPFCPVCGNEADNGVITESNGVVHCGCYVSS